MACGVFKGGSVKGYRACAVHKCLVARLCHSRPTCHVRAAMCWKQVSKFQKSLYIILAYLILYLVISYVIASNAKVTFVSDEFRVGDKYVLMFLVAPRMPVLFDTEGADVFTSRKCGNCFITNNIGFLPMWEYDAVLVHGERALLTQSSAFMDPGKRYLIEANKTCLRRKFKGCIHEPVVTSFATRESYDFCGLCRSLLKKKIDS